MKKKIRDLTIREIKKICEDRFKKGFPYCIKCPLYSICQLSPDEMAQKDLDQEIEVDENEN
jgi:hypothetical protein